MLDQPYQLKSCKIQPTPLVATSPYIMNHQPTTTTSEIMMVNSDPLTYCRMSITLFALYVGWLVVAPTSKARTKPHSPWRQFYTTKIS